MAGPRRGTYTRLYQQFLASPRARSARGGGATLALSFSLTENLDIVDPNSKTARDHLSKRVELTGWERLKLMYSYDAYGKISPELSMVMQSGLMGGFTGSVIGGTLHSRESYLRFIERNQGTAFQNITEAQSQLQHKVTTGFGRGAWMVGWRLALFCSGFTLFTNSIACYRGKASVIEYSAGGAITGGLYKFKQGPRAAVAGAILGGGLGTLAGVINVAILYLTGTSNDQLRQFHYEWQEEQQQRRLEALRNAREKDTDVLGLQHSNEASPSDLEALPDEDPKDSKAAK